MTGSGDILFDENGIPLYDESEQIFMRDDTGAEVGIFKAYTTVRDGEVTKEDGSTQTEKQCVGYLETVSAFGARGLCPGGGRGSGRIRQIRNRLPLRFIVTR